MKDVLLNVSKMAKKWIGELITFKLMHLLEPFIQSDSNIAFRVYSLSFCVLPENQTHDIGVASDMLHQLSYRSSSNIHYGHKGEAGMRTHSRR